MRIPDYRFSSLSVFIAIVIGIFGTGILSASVLGHTQERASIRVLVHGVNALPVAARPAARQDAGQAAPSTAASPAPKPVDLPEGDGKPIATEFCQECHKLTNLTKAHKTEDDWKDTIQTMVERGARIPDEKIGPLAKYLAKNFGPASASPAGGSAAAASAAPAQGPNAASSTTSATQTVDLPDGDGKAIATEDCQACHKLTNLTKAHKSLDEWKDTVQTMIDRGANVPTDKIDILVQYLAKNFGPKDASAPATTAPGSSTQSQ